MNKEAKTKDSTEERSESGKILFWTSIGPVLLLLTALIGYMQKASHLPLLGLIALLSSFTVFFLRTKGTLVSALLFGSALAYDWFTRGFLEGPSIVLLAISYFLGVFVFSLGLSEAKALLDKIETESKSRLSALWKLEEKARGEEKRFEQELAKLHKVQASDKDEGKEQEIASLQEKLQEQQKMQESNRLQIEEMQGKIDHLTHELKQRDEGEAAKRSGELAAFEDIKKELEEANRQLQEHEGEEIRLRTIQKEMSSLIERLNQEQDVLSQALAKGEEVLERKEEEQASLLKEVAALKEQLAEKEEKFNLMSSELQRLGQGYKEKEFVLRGIVQEANARNAQLEREIKDLSERSSKSSLSGEKVSALELELKEAKSEIKALSQETQGYKETIREMDGFKEKLSALDQEKQAALDECRLLRESIDELTSQNLALKQEVQRVQESAASPEEPGEEGLKEIKKKCDGLIKEREKLKEILTELKALRKEDAKKSKEVQGQYKQLKQQFEEKAEALDDSRKALFHMQEKLLMLQREAEEKPANDRSEMERLLEKQIAKMEKEKRDLLTEHQEEVNALQEIIDALSNREASAALRA